MATPIRTVLIVGGGLAAWMTAAAFARHVPGVEVTVLDDAGSGPEVVDVCAGTGPSFRHFVRGLGVNERNLVGATGGVFRLGQLFEGWQRDTAPYLHGHAPYGAPLDGIAFHQLWLRAVAGGDPVPRFDACSYASALAGAGAFDLPDAVADFDYGFNLDPAGCRSYLRGFAEHLGVGRIDDALAEVRIASPERIAQVVTRRGDVLAADLYVDCTGPAAHLLSGLEGGHAWEDWRCWLPCDRLVCFDEPAASNPDPFDRAIATVTGWRLVAPLRRRTLIAQLGRAAEVLAAGSGHQHLQFAQGRRQRPWIGNCVCIGEAAVVLEPLEAAPMAVLCALISHLLATLPDTDFAAVELAEFERRTRLAAEASRDLISLHYQLTDRQEPFWRDAGRASPPTRVADVLALFRERGKVPRRDGEPLLLEDWLAVLIGQGAAGRLVGAMVDRVPADAAAQWIRHVSDTLAAAAGRAPSHRRFLERFLSQPDGG